MGAKVAKIKEYRVSLWIALGAGVLGLSACFVDSFEVPPEGSTGEGGGAGSVGSSTTGSGSGMGGASTTGTGGGSTSSVATGTGGGSASFCGAGEFCAPSVDGWEGPYRVREGEFNTIGGCPNGNSQAYKGAYDPVKNLPECTCDCNCVGMGCTDPQFTCWEGVKCDNTSSLPIGPVQLNKQVDCYAIPPSQSGGVVGACMITGVTSPIPPTSCQPSNAKKPPLPLWNKEVQVCEASGSGAACDGGTCAAYSETGFPGAICVVKQGDDVCPDEYKNVRTLVYRNFTDNRTCGTCNANKDAVKCSAPSIAAASAVCSVVMGDPLSECKSVATSTNLQYSPPVANMAAGACTAQIQGEVVGANPLTICCRPLQ